MRPLLGTSGRVRLSLGSIPDNTKVKLLKPDPHSLLLDSQVFPLICCSQLVRTLSENPGKLVGIQSGSPDKGQLCRISYS
jgi:hypothetical protein